MELDTSGFATQGPTVFAGNIGDNKYIIQVSPMGIRLLEGGMCVIIIHLMRWIQNLNRSLLSHHITFCESIYCAVDQCS